METGLEGNETGRYRHGPRPHNLVFDGGSKNGEGCESYLEGNGGKSRFAAVHTENNTIINK